LETVAVDANGQVKREDSLRKRYFYKLGSSLAGLPITLLVQALIPRMLGPAAYGNFSFLSTFFNQVVSFFDSGLSSGFYSKLSQRPHELGLSRFFAGLTAIVSGLVILAVLIVFGLQFDQGLWPGQEARTIWLAVIWGLLTWYTQIINKVMDAYGLTVPGEIVRFQQKVLGLGLILLMFWLQRFSLAEFFLYQYAILVFLGISWWLVLRRNGLALLPRIRLAFEQAKGYSREFYAYSAPLILIAFVGLVNNVQDRWFLQSFAGSVEQGFYGLSYQVGALCFLVSGSMTPLFWREIAKAFGEQNHDKMRSMLKRYLPLLYAIAAFLAVFVTVQAGKVTALVGGDDFQRAAVPISLMALYPMHQTYGQLGGTFLLAIGQTRLYRNLSIGMTVVDLLLTYWLLAPARLFGLGLGATGLAIKMIFVNFVAVNIQMWFICRFMRLPFRYFLAHQIYSAVLLASIAWLSAAAADLFIPNTLVSFVISGILYTLGCAGLVCLLPAIVGMSRTELRNQSTAIWLSLRSRLTPRH
jgi:O-antigen/teichoic acid export membrane protein